MKRPLPTLFYFAVYILLITTEYACSFCRTGIPPALCSLQRRDEISDIASSAREKVFEEEQTIVVYHGSTCANANTAGTKKIINVQETLELPSYVTNATVFLNGWHLKYLNNDLHVAGLGTVIDSIRIVDNKLIWLAQGAISDKNFDDAYEWCYNYTVIAWNGANVNLALDDNDGNCGSDMLGANFFDANNRGTTTTALASFPTFLYNPAFLSGKKVAIIPRGFAFEWGTSCEDYHLMQLGYNLDHSEIIMNKKEYKKNTGEYIPGLPDNTSRIDSGFVSWNTYTIFKDDATRRDYNFGEMVTGIGGSDVGIIEPPFSILPVKGSSSCITGTYQNVNTQEYKIYRIPFKHAIPVLTGWDLHFLCDDHQVKEIGIWIDKWSYEKTDGDLGTLTYTLSSILKDNSNNGGVASHNVAILGIEPSPTVGGGNGNFADLVPVSPLGTKPENFCRMQRNGQLRVTVKNTGTGNAGASKTIVSFNGTKVTVNTPPVASGASVDIFVNVPAGCFSPDCSFNIKVNADNQVNEHGSDDNNSANGICIG